MDLTPEERRRIYEEERARIEAEQAAMRKRVYDEEKAKEDGGFRARTPDEQQVLSEPVPTPTPEEQDSGYKVVIGLMGVLAVFIGLGVYSSYAENAKKNAEQARFEKSTADIQALVARHDELVEQLKGAVVQKGWKWEVDGEYDHIRGAVKNESKKPVQYWAVTAKFVRKGSETVVDSAYTNDGQLLLPGESKRFEIMHRNIPGTQAYFETTDVRFAN